MKLEVVAAILFISIIHLSEHVHAQNCLNHRIDKVPCEYKHPNITDTPDENEWGLYSTRIKQGPVCEIRRRDHKVGKIQTIGGDPRVMFIYSPGIELDPPEKYGDQWIMFYEVVCPPNHTAFFNITSIELEPANCVDPNEPEDPKCVDYVRVEHGLESEFGETESCGEDPGMNKEIHTVGTLRIVFRTDDNGRFPGFKSMLTCINTSEVDEVNITKRSTDEDLNFEEDMEKHTQDIRMITQSYKETGYFDLYQRGYPSLFRIDRVPVRFGHSFAYTGNMLWISSGKGSSRGLNQVLLLKVKNAEGVRVFEGSALDSRLSQPISFEGPGTLTVTGSIAFYTDYIVNPRGISPISEDERTALYKLTLAYYDQLWAPPETRFCDEFLNPPPIDFDNLPLGDPLDDDFSIPECPSPNVTTVSSCSRYTDDALLLALSKEDSENEILRTVADVMVTCAKREIPERVERLRNPLKVSCNITPSKSNSFMVWCSANRKSGVNVTGCRGVSISEKRTIQLDQYCTYPTFTFSTFEAGIAPGKQHRLFIDFIDEKGSNFTKNLAFESEICPASPPYGDPANCLLSRTELFECSFSVPARTPTPNANEVGIYSTRTRRNRQSNCPKCSILRRNSQIRSLQVIRGDPRIKVLYSPGAELSPPEKSPAFQYVLYNISCPTGHIAYFNLTSIDMEEENCFDSHSQRMLCKDYVRVMTDPFGYIEFCGRDTRNSEVFLPSDFSVLFRTGETPKSASFRATVVCIDRSGIEGYTNTSRTTRSLKELGIISTPEEVEAINSLLQSLVTLQEKARLKEYCNSITGQKQVSECVMRKKRHVPKSASLNDLFEDYTIELALKKKSSRNPILRTVTESALTLMRRHNPARLQRLQESLQFALEDPE